MTSRTVTILGFVLIALGAVALQIWSARPETRVASLGELLGHLMGTRTGRIGVLLSWWWLGWHFIAR